MGMERRRLLVIGAWLAEFEGCGMTLLGAPLTKEEIEPVSPIDGLRACR